MHARSISVRTPPMPTENGKHAFRGARVEAETILKPTGKHSLARANGGKYLMSLGEQTKTRGRFLSREEEYAIFGKYKKARQAIETLKNELKGLKNGAARTPKARRMERAIGYNENVMRSAESIVVAAHEGWLYRMAKRCMRIYSPRHLSEGDLVQEGRYALIRTAIPKFDPDMGNYFCTYATWWIRQAMERAVENYDSEIRVPVYRHLEAQQLNRFQRICLAKGGREPTEQEILDETGIDPAKLIAPKMVSIHQKDKDRSGKPWELLTRIPDENAENPEETAIMGNHKTKIRGMLGTLDPRERYVLMKRFGLDCREQTLEEIGEGLGVTRERIRQIEAKALGKLRRRNKLKNSDM